MGASANSRRDRMVKLRDESRREARGGSRQPRSDKYKNKSRRARRYV